MKIRQFTVPVMPKSWEIPGPAETVRYLCGNRRVLWGCILHIIYLLSNHSSFVVLSGYILELRILSSCFLCHLPPYVENCHKRAIQQIWSCLCKVALREPNVRLCTPLLQKFVSPFIHQCYCVSPTWSGGRRFCLIHLCIWPTIHCYFMLPQGLCSDQTEPIANFQKFWLAKIWTYIKCYHWQVNDSCLSISIYLGLLHQNKHPQNTGMTKICFS